MADTYTTEAIACGLSEGEIVKLIAKTWLTAKGTDDETADEISDLGELAMISPEDYAACVEIAQTLLHRFSHPQAPNTLSEVEDIATLRARATAAEDQLRDREAEIKRLRAEMPESLNTGNLVHDVRTLRMSHDSVHRRVYRWGKAALLLLPFVDMAAGEGLEWAEQEDGSPKMDAADLCAAFAKVMDCELGDATYMAMMTGGRAAIRALAQPDPSQEPGTGGER